MRILKIVNKIKNSQFFMSKYYKNDNPHFLYLKQPKSKSHQGE